MALDVSDSGTLSVPLSALEHVAYCSRQAALIHIEGTWADSVDTVRGDLAHRVIDLPGTARRKGVRAVRSLPVFSRVHGLHGVCDLVELEGERATPVEYKVGPYKPGGPADLQLAGQAVCLRESGYTVPDGYIYSASDRRRHLIAIGESLIDRTLDAAEQVRELYRAAHLPAARNDRRCRRCSLRDDCLPELTDASPHTMPDLFQPQPIGDWHD